MFDAVQEMFSARHGELDREERKKQAIRSLVHVHQTLFTEQRRKGDMSSSY
jgi:hypothetical protein